MVDLTIRQLNRVYDKFSNSLNVVQKVDIQKHNGAVTWLDKKNYEQGKNHNHFFGKAIEMGS
jgi:hypothetical protein